MGRKTTAPAKIHSLAEFRTLLDTLCVDLSDAHDHYVLFRNLLEAKENAFTKALSQSQTFWSLVYGANLDAAVFRLCRAYDQHPETLSLRTLIGAIADRPDWLPSPAGTLVQSELESALQWTCHESNPIVKNLMIWRHKVYAHRDVEKTITGDLANDFPVSHDDISSLIDRGFNIVNGYKVAFFQSAWMRDIHGAKDYLKVLKTLQDDVEAKEAQFSVQVALAKAASQGDQS